MSHYPFWAEETMDGRNILDVALDVRMTATGSLDRSDHKQSLDIQLLQWKLNNWKEDLDSYKKFDDLVKSLILESIEVVRQERDKRKMQI